MFELLYGSELPLTKTSKSLLGISTKRKSPSRSTTEFNVLVAVTSVESAAGTVPPWLAPYSPVQASAKR